LRFSFRRGDPADLFNEHEHRATGLWDALGLRQALGACQRINLSAVEARKRDGFAALRQAHRNRTAA
jgi:hypothetical protein